MLLFLKIRNRLLILTHSKFLLSHFCFLCLIVAHKEAPLLALLGASKGAVFLFFCGLL